MKQIKGYEVNYKISNFGYIVSLKTKKRIKEYLYSDGRVSVCLFNNNRGKCFLIEELMVSHFLENTENRKIIHIDGNNLNNNINNLRLDEEEIWKDIEGFEGHYQISNKGRVRTVAFKGRKNVIREIKSATNYNGYKKVCLTDKNGKRKNFFVHRLVCMAFVGDCTCLEVNHKDGNRSNNKVENIEICTRLENARHSWKKLGRKAWAKGIKGKYAPRSRPVVAKDKNGNIIAHAYSALEMAEIFNISQSSVLSVCHKQRKEMKSLGVVFEFGEKRERYEKTNNIS